MSSMAATWRLAQRALGIATLYGCTGWLGAHLDAEAGAASVVWLPAGVAHVALLHRFRLDSILGIFLGALVLDGLTMASPWAAGLIAFGSTLGAACGAYAVRRVGLRASLARLNDVLVLAALGGLGTGVINATMGVLGLWIGGMALHWPRVWSVWALGDAMGILIVAPVVLVWADRSRRRQLSWQRALEIAGLGSLLILANIRVFTLPAPNPIAPSAIYVFFPLLMWAATRFGQRGAATALFMVSVWAMAGTAVEMGPFLGGDRAHRLIALQLFLAIIVVTVLVLGAVIEERREAIRLRDDFLFVASHELKTPLTALRLAMDNLTRALQRQAEAAPTPWERKLQACHLQLDRLGILVEELLDASRMSGRKLLLRREPADLSQITQAVIERLHAQAERAHCLIHAELGSTAWGQWDIGRVDQVVTNVLSNAIKYGAGKPIGVQVEADGQFARLSVRDSGIGVASYDIARIFERFERAVSHEYYGGLGLGLHVARQVVHAHGGRIRVESAPGQGATFIVELPRDGSPYRDAPHPPI
jgi:signal transduction histidine kinase